MLILKSYKYRIYPNKEQEKYLNFVFGSVRFVWNNLVANFNEYSSVGPNRPMTEKILKDDLEFGWLNDSISYALQQKRMDFEETKGQYFSKTRKKKLGRMKFKKKGVSKDSFRIPGQALGYSKCINFETSRIKIPKMKPIKIVIDRKFNGILKSITVSRNSCNQFFISCLVEETREVKPTTNRSIGLDLGLNHLLTFSDGTKIDNPRWFRESQSKLKRAQQHLSRKVKGSNRYQKQRLKVAKIHLKIANQRAWFHHNLSRILVDNFDLICMENLNVAGMKGLFGKSISDAAFSSLVSMISYKSQWDGRTFHQIGRFVPSSKTCSCCGFKMSKDEMNLGVREWTCPSCGSFHDRDENAAINILKEGLRDLYDFTSDEIADYRRGEEVRQVGHSSNLHSSLKRLG